MPPVDLMSFDKRTPLGVTPKLKMTSDENAQPSELTSELMSIVQLEN